MDVLVVESLDESPRVTELDLGYLTEHCCGGQACEVVPPACTDCGDPA